MSEKHKAIVKEELGKWKTRMCEREREQQAAVQDYLAQGLGKLYKEEIGALLNGAHWEEMKRILTGFGAITGVMEIIGKKRFLELESEGTLQGIFPSNSKYREINKVY